MSFGKRQAFVPPATNVASHPLDARIALVSSLAAAAIGAFIVTYMVWPMLGVPDELGPFGGVQLDTMPEVTRAWAPAYVPPVVMAIISFLHWRRVALARGKPGIIRGAMSMGAMVAMAFLVAFEALYLGQFVQALPLMENTVQVAEAFVVYALQGLGYAGFFMLYFGKFWIPLGAIIGAVLAGLTRVAVAGVNGGSATRAV